jgi:hypothetical protein
MPQTGDGMPAVRTVQMNACSPVTAAATPDATTGATKAAAIQPRG